MTSHADIMSMGVYCAVCSVVHGPPDEAMLLTKKGIALKDKLVSVTLRLAGDSDVKEYSKKLPRELVCVCVCLCMHVCMSAYVQYIISTYVCTYVSMYLCMYVPYSL